MRNRQDIDKEIVSRILHCNPLWMAEADPGHDVGELEVRTSHSLDSKSQLADVEQGYGHIAQVLAIELMASKLETKAR